MKDMLSVFPLVKVLMGIENVKMASYFYMGILYNPLQTIYILKTLYITSNDKMPIQLLLKRIENDIQFLANSTEGGNYAERERMRELLPTESFRMALVILVVFPIMVAYPFFQKFFIKGMTVGAVKG